MSDSGATLIAWTLAGALLGAVLAIPQPVAPWEMPSLVLDRGAVAASVRQNEELSSGLTDGEEIGRLQALFIAHGLAEINPPYARADYDTRQAEVHHALEALERRAGPQAFAALRARAVEDFMEAFPDASRQPEGDAESGMLGGFGQILDRYGAVVEGVLVAPPMTVRAMYKARWNLIHRNQATNGFSKIEEQAYWGWLALHGWGVPVAERIDALKRYEDAGGRNAAEAAALFDLLERRPGRAARLLETLYEQEHQLRLRNLALGALAAVPPRSP
ncbi:MAG: hypothetical protein AAF500_12770 [Myxococcota bacterium]